MNEICKLCGRRTPIMVEVTKEYWICDHCARIVVDKEKSKKGDSI